jgi:hypothetical protein
MAGGAHRTAGLPLGGPFLAGSGLAAAGVVAVTLCAPLTVLAAQALGVDAAAPLGLIMALPLTLCIPPLAVLLRGRQGAALVLAAAGAVLLGWIGWRAEPTAATPAPTSLFYLLDAETSEASWLSYEEGPDAWTDQVIPADTVPDSQLDVLPGTFDAGVRRAPAPAVALAAPTATLIEDRAEGDSRLVRLRLRSPRSAPALLVGVDASMATVRALGVEGEELEIDGSGDQPVLMLHAVPPEGVEISIRTLDRQPLALTVVDWTWGLAEVAPRLAPRPPHLVRSTRWLTDSVLVRDTFWF